MQTSDVPPARTRTAIALSIAVHACALWLLALLVENRELPTADEGASSLRVFALTTITRRPAPVAALHVAPQPHPTAIPRRPEPAAVPTARAVGPAPAPAATTAVGRAAPSQAQPNQRRAHDPASRARLSVALVAPAPSAPAAAVPSPTLEPPTPAPTPSAAASPSPPPTPPAADFGGLFSQNYPPAVAEPGELARLRARLGSPVHVRIDVDENGRAVEVRFVHPLADPDLASQVRTTLLTWRYVPADCNGLHCDGTLEITF